MRKILKIAAVVMVALVVVVMGGGMLLRENYHAELELTLNQPPEKVWAAVMDFDKNPIAGSQRQSTRKLPDENGLPLWVENIGASELTVRTLEASAPSTVKREARDSVIPLTLLSDIRIEPAGAGSKITQTAHVTVRSGTWHVPIFRWILTIAGAETGPTDYWNRLASTFGEKPQIAVKH